MTKILVTLALLGLVPSCTVVGAVTGGSLADSHNSDRREALLRHEHAEPEVSVGTSMLQGAVVGAVIDAALIFVATSAARTSGSGPAGFAGYSDMGHD